MDSEYMVDLCFRVLGKRLPVDHGFALHSALSRILPSFHDAKNVGLRLIRGRYVGGGLLDIAPSSELVIRLPSNEIANYIQLGGKTLELMEVKLTLGVPKTRALTPVSELYSHLVTTRNCQNQKRFETEISNQMESLGVKGKFIVGDRKTFRIHGKQVVGYSLKVTDLDSDGSIVIQEKGLGGRRKMGCGFFEPVRDDK